MLKRLDVPGGSRSFSHSGMCTTSATAAASAGAAAAAPPGSGTRSSCGSPGSGRAHDEELRDGRADARTTNASQLAGTWSISPTESQVKYTAVAAMRTRNSHAVAWKVPPGARAGSRTLSVGDVSRLPCCFLSPSMGRTAARKARSVQRTSTGRRPVSTFGENAGRHEEVTRLGGTAASRRCPRFLIRGRSLPSNWPRPGRGGRGGTRPARRGPARIAQEAEDQEASTRTRTTSLLSTTRPRSRPGSAAAAAAQAAASKLLFVTKRASPAFGLGSVRRP